jgi:hypothetical protein
MPKNPPLFMYQTTIKPQKKSPAEHNNNKKWFTPEIKRVKSELMELTHRPKFTFDSDLKDRMKSMRKEFRKVQRHNIFIIEQKELEKFESLTYNGTKNKFWKSINNQKKIRSTDKTPSISPTNLTSHYKNFFNENYDNLNHDQKLIKEDVDEYYNNYSHPEILPLFTFVHLEDVIKDLEHSNVQGADKITYTLIKKIKNPKLIVILQKNFNKFIIDSHICRIYLNA